MWIQVHIMTSYVTGRTFFSYWTWFVNLVETTYLQSQPPIVLIVKLICSLYWWTTVYNLQSFFLVYFFSSFCTFFSFVLLQLLCSQLPSILFVDSVKHISLKRFYLSVKYTLSRHFYFIVLRLYYFPILPSK